MQNGSHWFYADVIPALLQRKTLLNRDAAVFDNSRHELSRRRLAASLTATLCAFHRFRLWRRLSLSRFAYRKKKKNCSLLTLTAVNARFWPRSLFTQSRNADFRKQPLTALLLLTLRSLILRRCACLFERRLFTPRWLFYNAAFLSIIYSTLILLRNSVSYSSAVLFTTLYIFIRQPITLILEIDNWFTVNYLIIIVPWS